MKRFMGYAMVSVLMLGGVGACSKDKAADTTVAAVTAAPADTAAADTAAADTVAAAGGDDAVAAFCTQADTVAKKFKEVMADPSKGDVAALTAEAQKLSATAATLSGSNADQAAKVSECAQKMAKAMTPGA